MLLRIGKASFQYGVREQGALMGVAGAALKLMPHKGRIKFVLNAMVNALIKTNPQVDAWVEEEGDKIAYCESTCDLPGPSQRPAGLPPVRRLNRRGRTLGHGSRTRNHRNALCRQRRPVLPLRSGRSRA
jgi:hypothetical protein